MHWHATSLRNPRCGKTDITRTGLWEALLFLIALEWGNGSGMRTRFYFSQKTNPRRTRFYTDARRKVVSTLSPIVPNTGYGLGVGLKKSKKNYAGFFSMILFERSIFFLVLKHKKNHFLPRPSGRKGSPAMKTQKIILRCTKTTGVFVT